VQSGAVLADAGGTLDAAAWTKQHTCDTLLSLLLDVSLTQLLINSYMGQGVAMLLMAAGFSLPALKELSPAIAVSAALTIQGRS
jgi:hypothetical protein